MWGSGRVLGRGVRSTASGMGERGASGRRRVGRRHHEPRADDWVEKVAPQQAWVKDGYPAVAVEEHPALVAVRLRSCRRPLLRRWTAIRLQLKQLEADRAWVKAVAARATNG